MEPVCNVLAISFSSPSLKEEQTINHVDGRETEISRCRIRFVTSFRNCLPLFPAIASSDIIAVLADDKISSSTVTSVSVPLLGSPPLITSGSGSVSAFGDSDPAERSS